MVAPLWTDLVATGRNSGIRYEDTGDGRFVVEFREMEHYDEPTALETFEIIEEVTSPISGAVGCASEPWVKAGAMAAHVKGYNCNF